MGPWIGVDFDGTLAMYGKWQGANSVGAPIPKMVDRVKKWLAEGKDVRIVTARVFVPNETQASVGERWSRHADAQNSIVTINKFCEENFGRTLPITCTKDFAMTELWDDRAVQVIKNTGETYQERYENLERLYRDSEHRAQSLQAAYFNLLPQTNSA